jgi:hypothetical protein
MAEWRKAKLNCNWKMVPVRFLEALTGGGAELTLLVKSGRHFPCALADPSRFEEV